jgi:Flp pilus assembly pilin Flp
MKFTQFINQFHREESGQDMLEYALVLLAVLAAVVAGSNTLQTTISGELTTINTAIGGLTLP